MKKERQNNLLVPKHLAEHLSHSAFSLYNEMVETRASTFKRSLSFRSILPVKRKNNGRALSKKGYDFIKG